MCSLLCVWTEALIGSSCNLKLDSGLRPEGIINLNSVCNCTLKPKSSDSMNSRTKNTCLSQAPMTSLLPKNVFVFFFFSLFFSLLMEAEPHHGEFEMNRV